MAGAGLPLPPLKGPFLDFPALGGPELPKLGGPGGVLYPPPFLYGPYDPPVLQVSAGRGWGRGQSKGAGLMRPRPFHRCARS